MLIRATLGQDRTGQDRTGQDRTGYNYTLFSGKTNMYKISVLCL